MITWNPIPRTERPLKIAQYAEIENVLMYLHKIGYPTLVSLIVEVKAEELYFTNSDQSGDMFLGNFEQGMPIVKLNMLLTPEKDGTYLLKNLSVDYDGLSQPAILSYGGSSEMILLEESKHTLSRRHGMK